MAAATKRVIQDESAIHVQDSGLRRSQSSRTDPLEQTAKLNLSERQERMVSRANQRLCGLHPQHLEEVIREVVVCSVGEIVGTVESIIDRAFQSGKFSGAIEGVVTRFCKRDIQRILATSSESFHFERWEEVESQVRDICEVLDATKKTWDEKSVQPTGGSPQAVAALSQELGAMRERMELMFQEFLAPQSAEVQGSIEGLEGRIEEVREELRWFSSQQADVFRKDAAPMREDIESNSRALEVLTGRCIDIANRVDAAAASAADAAAAAERAERSAVASAAAAASAPATPAAMAAGVASMGTAAKAAQQENMELGSSPSTSKVRDTHQVKENHELVSSLSTGTARESPQVKAEANASNLAGHRHHEASDPLNHTSHKPHHHRDVFSPQHHHPRERTREAGQLNNSTTTLYESKEMKGPLAECRREVVQLAGRLDEYMARMEAIREELQLHTIEQCEAFQAKVEEKLEAKFEAAVAAATVDAKRNMRSLTKKAHTDSSVDLRGPDDSTNANCSGAAGGMLVDSRGHRHHAAGHSSIPKHLTQHSEGSSWGQQQPNSPSHNGDSTASLDSTRRFIQQLEGAEARRNRKHSNASAGLSTAITAAPTPDPAAASNEWTGMRTVSPKEEDYDGHRMKRVDSQDQWSLVADSGEDAGLAGLHMAKTPSTPHGRALGAMGRDTPDATNSLQLERDSLGSNAVAAPAQPLTEAPMRLPPMEKQPRNCSNFASVDSSMRSEATGSPSGTALGGIEVQAPLHGRPRTGAESSNASSPYNSGHSRPGRQLQAARSS